MRQSAVWADGSPGGESAGQVRPGHPACVSRTSRRYEEMARLVPENQASPFPPTSSWRELEPGGVGRPPGPGGDGKLLCLGWGSSLHWAGP